MNRRSFLARCLSGAVLGMARVLPMPDLPKTPRLADGELPFFRNRHFDVMILDDIMSDTTPLDRAAIKVWFDNIKMPPGSKLVTFSSPCEPF